MVASYCFGREGLDPLDLDAARPAAHAVARKADLAFFRQNQTRGLPRSTTSTNANHRANRDSTSASAETPGTTARRSSPPPV